MLDCFCAINDLISKEKPLVAMIDSVSPKYFCSGADLKERKEMNFKETLEFVEKLRNCFKKFNVNKTFLKFRNLIQSW